MYAEHSHGGKTEESRRNTEKKDWKYDAVLIGLSSGNVSFGQVCNVYEADWTSSTEEKGLLSRRDAQS